MHKCRQRTHTVRESVQLQKGATLGTYSFALEQNRQTKCSRTKNLCAFCLSMNGIRDALIRYSASVVVLAKIIGLDIGEGKKVEFDTICSSKLSLKCLNKLKMNPLWLNFEQLALKRILGHDRWASFSVITTLAVWCCFKLKEERGKTAKSNLCSVSVLRGGVGLETSTPQTCNKMYVWGGIAPFTWSESLIAQKRALCTYI